MSRIKKGDFVICMYNCYNSTYNEGIGNPELPGLIRYKKYKVLNVNWCIFNTSIKIKLGKNSNIILDIKRFRKISSNKLYKRILL